MEILAISGSARLASTNTALLRSVATHSPPDIHVSLFDGLAGLPVFSPDLEVEPLPQAVADFVARIRDCDGIILSCPEYVRAIPGGLKNAIDWLVSRDEIVQKPIALMHASHRGDDMLMQLRLVLTTVSTRFADQIFLRFELMKKSPDEIAFLLSRSEHKAAIESYLHRFEEFCRDERMAARQKSTQSPFFS
ncbi:NAD(P)H-dependent oxidoreductase [Paracoccus aurantiacus]|uniref:NAD(P)H-dependent oxidoreductase n=1 Tax=Paracoccus aurantiacus TaxID=2599412 RepID=A0A5C6S7B1_9RHOB|nr:NADPH-dependent FMN reductase [Paracoccus aurantiacus]TXB69672.1 NAD(P)H-dependent oxidoreductase [Paracoccus aurantiacus]